MKKMTRHERQDLIFWSFIFSAISGLLVMPLWTALHLGALFPYDGTQVTEERFFGSFILICILTATFICSTIVAVVNMIVQMYKDHQIKIVVREQLKNSSYDE
jgi:hypothetical protein